MTGVQQTVYERILAVANAVKDGKYGTNDDVDVPEVMVDLEEALDDL